ncbi:helix-turn-helix domain-containing protein [Pectinatus sottacetonis]|uniref:helix-turn-helix domain-containing protein n=1 Tax=Pectinatus sottacetonis TaxID=1002795 RepID=UPI0018C7474D|nr:helix-turn-helix domain-containing protein [Pectinatus sottacetonis]
MNLLSVKDVNKQFFDDKYSSSAILNLAWRGILPSMKIGRRVWFDQNELEKYINSLKSTTTTIPPTNISTNLADNTSSIGPDIIFQTAQVQHKNDKTSKECENVNLAVTVLDC